VEIHPDAVHATVDAEMVVMNIQSMDYYRFNPVAKRIWDLVESGPISEEQLCSTLLDEYEVDEQECKTAVAEFLDEALSRGFVRIA
jgi:hypothetical protein